MNEHDEINDYDDNNFVLDLSLKKQTPSGEPESENVSTYDGEDSNVNNSEEYFSSEENRSNEGGGTYKKHLLKRYCK